MNNLRRASLLLCLLFIGLTAAQGSGKAYADVESYFAQPYKWPNRVILPITSVAYLPSQDILIMTNGRMLSRGIYEEASKDTHICHSLDRFFTITAIATHSTDDRFAITTSTGRLEVYRSVNKLSSFVQVWKDVSLPRGPAPLHWHPNSELLLTARSTGALCRVDVSVPKNRPICDLPPFPRRISHPINAYLPIREKYGTQWKYLFFSRQVKELYLVSITGGWLNHIKFTLKDRVDHFASDRVDPSQVFTTWRGAINHYDLRSNTAVLLKTGFFPTHRNLQISNLDSVPNSNLLFFSFGKDSYFMDKTTFITIQKSTNPLIWNWLSPNVMDFVVKGDDYWVFQGGRINLWYRGLGAQIAIANKFEDMDYYPFCPSGFWRLQNGRCVQQGSPIPEGFGPNPGSANLLPCNTKGCLDCSADYNVCRRCRQGFTYFAATGLCYSLLDIPNGFGINPATGNVDACADRNCQRCRSNNKQCELCNQKTPFKFLNPDTRGCQIKLVIKDGTGIDLSTGKIVPCQDPYCLNCQSDHRFCTQCNPKSPSPFIHASKGVCLPKAFTEAGFGFDILSFTFRECEDTNCNDCTADFRKCTVCKPSTFYDKIRFACFDEGSIPDGFGPNLDNGLVLKCADTSCADCSENYLVCEACSDASANKFLFEGKCLGLAKIPEGFGPDDNGLLIPCESDLCADCRSDFNVCTRCKVDPLNKIYRYNDGCFQLTELPDGVGLHPTKDELVDCTATKCRATSQPDTTDGGQGTGNSSTGGDSQGVDGGSQGDQSGGDSNGNQATVVVGPDAVSWVEPLYPVIEVEARRYVYSIILDNKLNFTVLFPSTVRDFSEKFAQTQSVDSVVKSIISQYYSSDSLASNEKQLEAAGNPLKRGSFHTFTEYVETDRVNLKRVLYWLSSYHFRQSVELDTLVQFYDRVKKCQGYLVREYQTTPFVGQDFILSRAHLLIAECPKSADGRFRFFVHSGSGRAGYSGSKPSDNQLTAIDGTIKTRLFSEAVKYFD